MSRNDNLIAAKAAKRDEFYTRLPDIEAELRHYYDRLRGKVVYCNCDDPEISRFWEYFDDNFDLIGLNGLIATHYVPGGTSYVSEIRRDFLTGRRTYPTRRPLAGDGDFRSDECIELLDRCDVVVTNPPFSLFREFVALLMGHGKEFIVIGSMNAITYKEIFPLLQSDRVWLGHTSPKRFLQPDGGLRSFGNILWYTNVDVPKRHERLPLTAFDDGRYPMYVNYDGMECGRIKDIPCNWFGDMGVPITFLTKYCPEQFEIIGLSRTLGQPMSEIARPGEYEPGGVRFYLYDLHGPLKYRRLYERVVIRRRREGSV